LLAADRAGDFEVRAAGPHGLDELPSSRGADRGMGGDPEQGAARQPGDLPQRRPEGQLPGPSARQLRGAGKRTGQPAALSSRVGGAVAYPGPSAYLRQLLHRGFAERRGVVKNRYVPTSVHFGSQSLWRQVFNLPKISGKLKTCR